MKVDILTELAEAEARWRASLPGCLRYFVKLGLRLPRADLTRVDCPRWGLATILPMPDQLYEPGEDAAAVTALILPLHDSDGHLVDLLAWRSAAGAGAAPHEAAWWRRTGLAPLLGLPAAAEAWWGDGPLLLQPTPAAWLAAEGAGACVLDWDHREVDWLLRGVPSIEIPAGCEAFAETVYRWLRRPVKRRFPDIFIAGANIGREEVA